VDEGEGEKRAQARGLAQRALREQALGNASEADRLFAEAMDTVPQAVANVLQENETLAQSAGPAIGDGVRSRKQS
jgi:hypothetical protein